MSLVSFNLKSRDDRDHRLTAGFVTTKIYPALNTGSVTSMCPQALLPHRHQRDSIEALPVALENPRTSPTFSMLIIPQRSILTFRHQSSINLKNMVEMGNRRLSVSVSRSFTEVTLNDKYKRRNLVETHSHTDEVYPNTHLYY